jgi:hypothetical protein
VVERNVGVRIASLEITAGPRTRVFKPRGTQHTFWNSGPQPARLIEIITPGTLANYFEELTAILGSGGPPNQGKIDQINLKYKVTYSIEWVLSLMSKYGLKKLVGDP